MELATRSFTSTTVEGDGSREVDGREETATEETAAKKAEASEQADGVAVEKKIKKGQCRNQLGIDRGGGRRRERGTVKRGACGIEGA